MLGAQKPNKKCEKPTLDWERACLAYNAAAAHGYAAARAQERGVAHGGIREAARLYQRAAGCVDVAFDIVKKQIWGLAPAWPPSSLTPDMSLECLGAMRTLMLAHAQAAFRAKADAEGLGDATVSKIGAQAAKLYGEAHTALAPLRDHLGGETGLFQSADHSWLGRLHCTELRVLAHAEERAARAHATAREFGLQVARLGAAVSHLAVAVSAAEGSSLGGSERSDLKAELERVRHAHAEADRENATVYVEEVRPYSW